MVSYSGKCRTSRGGTSGGRDVEKPRCGRNGKQYCPNLRFSFPIVRRVLRIHAVGGPLLGKIGSIRFGSRGVMDQPSDSGQRFG
jgi:hypothetical protein